MRKRVQILSPLRASQGRTVEDHILFAERLCHLAATKGNAAPFAPHTFYTRFLDDRKEEDRKTGMECGAYWLLAADEVWVWDLWGVTEGMQAEIDLVQRENAQRILRAVRHLSPTGPIGEKAKVIEIVYARSIPCWAEMVP